MKYVLKIIKGNNYNSKFEILEGDTYEIRRNQTKDRDKLINLKNIFLEDDEISKLHAKLFMLKGELIIHDLASTNGTFINNNKINKAVLFNADIIKVGTTELKVSREDCASELTFIRKKNNYNKLTKNFKNFLKQNDDVYIFDPDINILQLHSLDGETQLLMKDVKNIILKGKDSEEQVYIKDYFFQVEVIEGVQKGQIFKFYSDKIIVGRVGDLIIEDKLISREHIEIQLISEGLFKIKDLGSLNNTLINNKEIKVATLCSNDILKIGGTSLKLKYLAV